MSKADNRNKELILEVIHEMEERAEREQNSKRRKVFHNTELLMRNYNTLKQHSENAVYSFNQMHRAFLPFPILNATLIHTGALTLGIYGNT